MNVKFVPVFFVTSQVYLLYKVESPIVIMHLARLGGSSPALA